MSSINRNSKFFILGLVVLATVIPAVWLITKNQQPETFISPLPSSSVNRSVSSGVVASDYDEPQRSISYYITTSQEFLNKARQLANFTPGESLRNTPGVSAGVPQTPEEKQKIIATINQAIDLANQAIAFYPNDDRGFVQRANIYQALAPFLPESINFAIRDLKEAIKLNRQNPEYHSQLAELYFKNGDFENASLAFYNHYTLSPIDIQVIYNLADALEKSGQPRKALHYFEKLLALLPPDDENMEAIKSRQQQLKTVIAEAGLEYLSEPGAFAEAPVGQRVFESQPEIIGTQELPLEQAALASQVIIAGPNMNTPGESLRNTPGVSEVSTNAKSGTSVIPAGEIEVTIENKYVANDKQIILMPLSNSENQVLYLKAKKAPAIIPPSGGTGGASPDGTSEASLISGWFKVGIDKPISNNLEFKWWIIE